MDPFLVKQLQQIDRGVLEDGHAIGSIKLKYWEHAQNFDFLYKKKNLLTAAPKIIVVKDAQWGKENKQVQQLTTSPVKQCIGTIVVFDNGIGDSIINLNSCTLLPFPYMLQNWPQCKMLLQSVIPSQDKVHKGSKQPSIKKGKNWTEGR